MIQFDNVQEVTGIGPGAYESNRAWTPASSGVVDFEQFVPVGQRDPVRHIPAKSRRIIMASANLALGAYIILTELPAEAGCYPDAGYLIQDVDQGEMVVADTNRVLSTSEMARMLDSVSRPTKRESVPLPFDPDDYPLF